MDQNNPSFQIHSQNIIPFYLVEDRLRDNFNNISAFISFQTQNNKATDTSIAALRDDLAQFKKNIDQKFITVEKSIVAEIGRELDGRIVVAINKNMASFSTRMQQKQKEIGAIGTTINTKLEDMKKKILYQSAKEQQKNISKEVEKIEKKITTLIEENSKKAMSPLRSSSREKHSKPVGLREDYGQSQNHLTEDWVLKIKDTEARVQKIQEFMVNFDKRFYENITTLKESWRQIGEDILQTKKKLTVKQDELRLELVKIRGIKQFEGAPEEVQETFKKKIMQKFTDIYQLVGQLVTRTDLNSETQRLKKISLRHDSEISDLRQQMAKNSDYFTFYINNSHTQDLSAQIKTLKQDLQHKLLVQAERMHRQNQKNQQFFNEIAVLGANFNEMGQKQGQSDIKLSKITELMSKEVLRIDALQEHNNFTPQKLVKIHNTLDIDFSPNEQQLITKKQGTFTQNAAMKEIKAEINKLKDELFVLVHEVEETKKIRIALTGLEGRMQKIKIESQQANLSRKPWVCLSCDKNQKERQESERLKREVSKKKQQEGRASLFNKQKSEKLIKLVPAGEQKFQVYERYRQKYLSDSIKLPQIYKEKIGDKEPSLS